MGTRGEEWNGDQGRGMGNGMEWNDEEYIQLLLSPGMEWNEMTVTSFTLNMPLMCSTCVALVKEDALSLIPSMRALVVSAI